jgi:hypothetical protein
MPLGLELAGLPCVLLKLFEHGTCANFYNTCRYRSSAWSIGCQRWCGVLVYKDAVCAKHHLKSRTFFPRKQKGKLRYVEVEPRASNNIMYLLQHESMWWFHDRPLTVTYELVRCIHCDSGCHITKHECRCKIAVRHEHRLSIYVLQSYCNYGEYGRPRVHLMKRANHDRGHIPADIRNISDSELR